jgi:hypothetical protein
VRAKELELAVETAPKPEQASGLAAMLELECALVRAE